MASLFFPALIHSALFFFSVVRRMPVSLWLSNYRQNLLAHLSRRREARRAEEKERGKSLITLACSSVRSLIKPSYLPVTPSQGASLSHICALSAIKYLEIFSLKIIQDFCLGWILRKGKKKHTGSARDIHGLMEKSPLSVCACVCIFHVHVYTHVCVPAG